MHDFAAPPNTFFPLFRFREFLPPRSGVYSLPEPMTRSLRPFLFAALAVLVLFDLAAISAVLASDLFYSGKTIGGWDFELRDPFTPALAAALLAPFALHILLALALLKTRPR